MPHDVFFEIGLAETLYRRPDLAAETIRARGSTIGALLHAAAAMAEEVEFDGVVADDDGYLDSARGNALTRYVASEYGEARKGASASTVPLVLSRTGIAEVLVDAGTGFVCAEGVEVTLDTDVWWAAGDVSDKEVAATSAGVGPDMNLPAGRSWSAVGTLPDATITAANVEVAAGGNAEEKDEELVARVRDAVSRKVRGTVAACRLGALEVPDVRSAAVYETRDGQGNQSGGIVVTVGDSTGAGNAALAERVLTELEEWRPAGSWATADGSVPVLTSITVTTVWDAGFGTLSDQAALKSVIAAAVNRLKPRAAPADADAEEECRLTAEVISEVRSFVPGLKKLTPTVPVGTVEPDQFEVIRTRSDLITVL